MLRSLLVLFIAVTIGATVTVGGATSAGKTVNCGTLSVGPGALVHGSKAGANCLLRAYQQHCRSAVYRLSRFGVDTISVAQFRVVSRSSRCEIAVTTTFRVVPQLPHPTGHGYCSVIGRRGSDIVVTGCTGTGLTSVISLTGRR